MNTTYQVDRSKISASDECVLFTTKMIEDSTEASSPTSSIHSVRPLEWDSGADIGYQCKLDSGLSTVKRNEFVSGSIDLLESVTHNSNKERSSRHPLAHSSPFLCTLATVKRSSSSTESNEYSTSLNGSNDKYVNESSEQTESNRIVKWFSEMDIVAKRKILKANKPDITVRSQKNSKSLNDLSSLKCKSHPKCTKNGWSCETNAKNAKSPSEPTSVSHSSQPVILSPKHIGKSSYRCIDEKKNSDASDRDRHKRNSSSEIENEANGRQSGSCSFEYVPGCVYDSRVTDKSCASTSTVNSFSSEVTGGVELLLKYVNSLQVPHKQKILKKVTKFILNLDESILAKLKITDEEQRSDVTEEKNSSSRSSVCKSSIRSSYPTPNSGYNHKTDSLPCSSRSYSQYTNKSACTTESCQTIDGKRSSTISLYYRGNESNSLSSNNGHARTTSSMNHRSSCCSKSSDEVSTGNVRKTRSSNAYSLKQYLINERDTHLRWIKSNIEHLNNLKRLCESQKILRNELNELQKCNSHRHLKDIIPSNIQSDDLYCRTKKKRTVHHQLFDKNIESSVHNGRKMSSCEVLSSYSSEVQKTHCKHKKKCSNKEVNLGNNDFVRHMYFCKHLHRTSARKSSGNKENVPTACTGLGDRPEIMPLKSHRFGGSCDTPKTGVYYSLLFDKKRRFRSNKKQFEAEAHAREKSRNRLENTEESETNTASTTQIQGTSNELKNNNAISLQEYLMRNNPSFYNIAEYRRQCLSEIAKLRELRDESRKKFWLAGESDSGAILEADKISTVAPLPLSVFRIFDERVMKRETKKKYYKLPEVKNKKHEVERQLDYRRNRIMADIFAKKLQKKVLRGKVHLGNNVNLMEI